MILKPTVAAVDVQQNRFDSTELKQNTCQLKDSLFRPHHLLSLPRMKKTSFTVQSVENPPQTDTVPKRLRRYQRATNVASQCFPVSSGMEARVRVRTYLGLLININGQLTE